MITDRPRTLCAWCVRLREEFPDVCELDLLPTEHHIFQ